LSLKTKVDGLRVVWHQNHLDGFSSVWASKSMTVVCPQNHLDGFLSVWPSKLMAAVCEWFDLKIIKIVFASLFSKPAMTVFSGLA
jgi:hypothetical protein